ncbi:Ig-like domain-containing protein [Frigoribacterium sp. VKM Ac-2836]|uniref:Ig-like domain-containing protein n=1 Tax=Frigoribacterium sp. VKM Ac-2836 TaxID=2739014 RepID=UPI001564D258|nr:Ig-like domain-containing protein [Frigoribacterium sp. VKM Ac-2836]NRD27879.1 hypothetical protein [Frigoribacterium sp. VKM Ac-2836]
MKKTLKTTGAFGLAAATIVTGLAFGPAATAATPPAADGTNAITVPQAPGAASPTNVYVGTVSTWIAMKFRGTDVHGIGYLTAPVGTTIEDAEIRDSSTGARDEARTSRIRIASDKKSLQAWGTSASGDNLHWGTEGYYLAFRLRVASTVVPGTKLTGGQLTVRRAPEFGGGFVAQGALNITALAAPFSAHVESVDSSTRSAVISGHAVPGSTILVNYLPSGYADDTGYWSAKVTGLEPGSNLFRVEARKDGTTTEPIYVDAKLDVASLMASVSFPADHTQNAVVSGTAEPGATIVVRDAAGTEIARTEASASGDSTWTAEIPAPNAGGDHPVTIQQEIDGTAAGEISLAVAYGPAVSITSPVDGAAHDTGPVTMTGTGEAGATVTVREQGTETILGATTVPTNGAWTLKTTNVNNRKRVLEVTQSGKGNNTTRSTVTLNPDNEKLPVIVAPTVVSPAAGSTVTTSRPTFSGTGQEGATVTIGYNAKKVIGTGVVKDGTWTITPTRGLGMGVSTLVVTQTAGDDVQTVTHTITRVAVEQPLSVTSHVNGQTYAPGLTTFRGTAPVGSTIRATNQWGTVMGATTATDGTWSFNRNLGPTTTGYDLTFVATPPTGAPQTVSLKLVYAGTLAFQVSSPKNNSTYAVGTTTFTGTAAPGTTITATNQWGTPMGRAETGLGTTWSFDRYLGPTGAGYDITFVATKGTQTQRTTVHLKPAVVNVPVAVTSHSDGATYRPGKNILTGTGTPGATIKAVNAKNNWNVPMGQTKVTADGTWALPARNWGPSNDYAIKVTQTNPDKTTSTTTVTVMAPVFAPLVLTSPAIGDTYDNGVAATFTGTATPYARVTVSSAKSTTVYRTVEADAQGNWSFTRTWGPNHHYSLNITQKALDGQTGTPITGFSWNSSGN